MIGRGSAVRIVGVPILGEYGVVHGVHLWCGSVDLCRSEPRVVAAWEWDSHTKLAHHGPGIEVEILGISKEAQREKRAPTDFFRRVVRFDDRESYYQFVDDLDAVRPWSGEITVRREDGTLRQLQMVARAYTEGSARSARGLFTTSRTFARLRRHSKFRLCVRSPLPMVTQSG